MKTFDFYEFTGVLMPGAVTLYGISRLFPEQVQFLSDKDVSVGSLGLFVVLAYAGGHMLQGLGNVVEQAYWRLYGGMPTDWVRGSWWSQVVWKGNPRKRFLTEEQTVALKEKLGLVFPTLGIKPIEERKGGEWFAITRQMYAAVQAAGRSQRVDTFNGNYGMFRGLATGFLLCLVLAFFPDTANWTGRLILFGVFLLAMYRMHRFGVNYGRELFIQFITFEPKGKTKEKGES